MLCNVSMAWVGKSVRPQPVAPPFRRRDGTHAHGAARKAPALSRPSLRPLPVPTQRRETISTLARLQGSRFRWRPRDGAAPLLDRLPEAVARHLRGVADAEIGRAHV